MNPYEALTDLLRHLTQQEVQSLLLPTLLEDLSGKEVLALLIQQHWREHYQSSPEKELSLSFAEVLDLAETRYGLLFNSASGRFDSE